MLNFQLIYLKPSLTASIKIWISSFCLVDAVPATNGNSTVEIYPSYWTAKGLLKNKAYFLSFFVCFEIGLGKIV